jgi:hypothetical protein
MLSYAFVANKWINALENSEGNSTATWYYYGLIIRSLFFYTIPEASSLGAEFLYSENP